MLSKSLVSLSINCDIRRTHRLAMVSNGISKESRAVCDYIQMNDDAEFLDVTEAGNIGTARAQNRAWKLRRPGEHVCKVDPDIVFHEPGWLDKLEECVAREPRIGIVGLKRPDLMESPNNPPGQWSHSELKMLPHQPGERWLVVEQVHHVIGSCALHSSALLDKVGYMWQPGLYGFDDGDISARSEVAGFVNCFYPHYHIDHIDPGGDDFTKWKQDHSGKMMRQFLEVRAKYVSGELPLWRDA